jgi:GT2 family glycosyltransferase
MARPVSSVIIPLFNKADLTRSCLAALIGATPPDLYEVVLVDNGSTDDTGALLDELDGDVTIIRNPQNLGFARACNQGAAAASGEHLVFLNNDTEVQAGWLEPLIGTADAHPTVGAVGSKLLYPDGTLQHAGVWIVDNRVQGILEARHRWHGQQDTVAEADVAQAVQAVTAAAMLVRASAFTAVGGFDEGYWNGNEDLDLCLQLGAAGWTIVYQPASRVVHYESASGPERWTKVGENILRLTRRWHGRVTPDVVLSA